DIGFQCIQIFIIDLLHAFSGETAILTATEKTCHGLLLLTSGGGLFFFEGFAFVGVLAIFGIIIVCFGGSGFLGATLSPVLALAALFFRSHDVRLFGMRLVTTNHHVAQYGIVI